MKIGMVMAMGRVVRKIFLIVGLEVWKIIKAEEDKEVNHCIRT